MLSVYAINSYECFKNATKGHTNILIVLKCQLSESLASCLNVHPWFEQYLNGTSEGKKHCGTLILLFLYCCVKLSCE